LAPWSEGSVPRRRQRGNSERTVLSSAPGRPVGRIGHRKTATSLRRCPQEQHRRDRRVGAADHHREVLPPHRRCAALFIHQWPSRGRPCAPPFSRPGYGATAGNQGHPRESEPAGGRIPRVARKPPTAANFGERQLRDCLKKASAAGYASSYGEKIPERPYRRRMGSAEALPPAREEAQ
jgi:hypothetical protein